MHSSPQLSLKIGKKQRVDLTAFSFLFYLIKIWSACNLKDRLDPGSRICCMILVHIQWLFFNIFRLDFPCFLFLKCLFSQVVLSWKQISCLFCIIMVMSHKPKVICGRLLFILLFNYLNKWISSEINTRYFFAIHYCFFYIVFFCYCCYQRTTVKENKKKFYKILKCLSIFSSFSFLLGYCFSLFIALGYIKHFLFFTSLHSCQESKMNDGDFFILLCWRILWALILFFYSLKKTSMWKRNVTPSEIFFLLWF